MPRFPSQGLSLSQRGFVPVALVVALAIILPHAVSAADLNPDYVKAYQITVDTAANLQSYELRGMLTMTNNIKGQIGGESMSAEMDAAARWPDRLLSSQSGEMFNLNLGTGPDQSWFFLGQLGNAYVGKPVALARDLAGAGNMDLTEEKIFNFYVGLGQFLLPAELLVTPDTASGTVTVNGQDVPCQIFTTMGPEVIADDGQPAEGPRTFYFDPASGLVLKSTLKVYFRRNEMDFEQDVAFTLKEFVLNGDVDDARFTFEAPAGTRVVDNLDRLTNPDAMTNQAAPDITFTDLDGNTFQLSDLRGQAVFIDFWATWCPPCKMEMPHIETLYREMGRSEANKSGTITIIAASSEDPATIRKFLAKSPYSFRIVTVDEKQAYAKYKTSSIPAGFVIDAEGIIRAHMIGAQTEQQLRAAFAKAGVK